MSSFLIDTLPRGLGLALTALLRAGLALLGFSLMIGFAFVALIAGAGLIAWALLRGRRPQSLQFAWRNSTARSPFGIRTPKNHKREGEVVDVEVRDVTKI